MLLLFTQFHPLIVYPLAQVSQLVGESKQVAHESAHLRHLDAALEPERVYPTLH